MAYMKRIVCREGEQEGDNKYWVETAPYKECKYGPTGHSTMNTDSWEDPWEENTRTHKPKHKDWEGDTVHYRRRYKDWEADTVYYRRRPWAYKAYNENTMVIGSREDSWEGGPHRRQHNEENTKAWEGDTSHDRRQRKQVSTDTWE